MRYQQHSPKLKTKTMAGNLIIISAPSGAGKTTLVQEVQKRIHGVRASISFTSRAPRPGEVDGKDYYFVTRDEFHRMVMNKEFLEWAEVHGNYYGTSRDIVTKMLQDGSDVVLTIDVQGAIQSRKLFHDAISIFVIPPSYEVLIERLTGRGSDEDADLKLRMHNAQKELEQYASYDYLIINDELEYAIREFESIVVAVRCRVHNRVESAELILKGFYR